MSAPDLDEVLQAMIDSGRFTQEQIDDFTALHMTVKYQPEEIEMPEPEEYFESDREVLLGKKKILVRFLSGHDIYRLAPKIDFLYASVSGESTDKKDGAPKDNSPVELTAKVFDKVIKDRQKGQFTALTKMVYEELAILASTDKEKITYSYLLSCPLGHIKNLMMAIIEVNQEDFLEWQGVKFNSLGSLASTLIGKFTSGLDWMKQALQIRNQ